MNLKQLLSKVEFDDVAPFIVLHYPEKAKCLDGFKMTFDGMRNTMPTNADEEQITVGYYPEGSIEPSLSAYHSHDDEWENVVGREVVIAKEVTASLEEIAAVILYDATFYGFTPETRSANFNKWWAIETPPSNGNPYRIRWWKMTQREHDSKCLKQDIGTRYYSAEPGRIFLEKPMNRIKRMRAHRWEKRIEELERLANRWDLLQQIKSETSTMQADGLDRAISRFGSELFKATRCQVKRFTDYSADGIGLPYIYELMTKYGQVYPQESLTLLWFQSPIEINHEEAMDICKLVWNPLPIFQMNVPVLERSKLTVVRLYANDKK